MVIRFPKNALSGICSRLPVSALHACTHSAFNLSKSFILCLLLVVAGVGSVSGQITTLSTWTSVYHDINNLSAAYTVPLGSNARRLLVVAIASSQTGTAARTATVTYGGQPLTSVAGDMSTTSVRQHTQLYYLNEAGLDAASSSTLAVTFGGGTVRINDIFAAVFDNVNQTTPITDSQTYSSGVTSVITFAFGTPLTVNANDQAIEIISSLRSGSTTYRTITPATNWSQIAQKTYNIIGDGVNNIIANRNISTTNTTDNSLTTLSNNTLASMTGMSIKEAPKYFQSIASGNWNATTTWQQSYDNSTWMAATSIPTSVDNSVIIQNGYTVTLNAPATASSLTITGNGVLDLSTYTLTGTGTMTVSSTGTLIIGGASNFPTGFTTTSLSSGSTVNYDNAGAQTVSNQTYSNLTLSGSGAKTLPIGTTSLGGNLTLSGAASTTFVANILIAGDLYVGTGTSLDLSTFTANRTASGGTLTVAGTLLLGGTSGGQGNSNFPTNFATMTMTGGTVSYDKAAGGQTVYSTSTYNNLTLGNTSGTQTAGGNLNVNGTLTTTAGGMLDMSTYTLTGTLGTVINAGTIKTSCTTNPPLATNINWGSAGTVEYALTTGGQYIPAGTFYNLKLDNTSNSNTAIGSLTVNGTLTTTVSGNLNMGTNQLLGTLSTITNGGTIQTQNASSTPIPTGKTWGGTVQYNATSGGQTVVAGTYGVLTQGNTSGTQTAGGNLAITTLNNINGGTLDMVGYTLSGTINNIGSTIRFNGASNGLAIGTGTVDYYGTTQTIATGTYATLTITAAGTKTAGGNIIATNLDNGGASNVAAILDMGGNTLTPTTIDNTGAIIKFSGAANGKAIPTGTIEYSATAGVQTVAAGTYNTLTLDNTSNTNTTGGAITATTLNTTAGGTLNMGTNTLTATTPNNSGTIRTQNITAIPVSTGLSWGGTVTYDGVAQTVVAGTYNNLTLSGSGAKSLQTGTTNIGGNLTLSGTATTTTVTGLTIGGNLSIGDGTTFTAAGFPLIITGTTNIGGGTSGNLTISNATGTKIFNGLVTVNTLGTWNNSANEDVTFRGGITNNGTFTAGTGIHTFDTNSQALTGVLIIPNVTVNSPATITNNGTLTISTALSGTGGLAQGGTGNLSIGGTSGITSFDASAVGNTVNYTGGSGQIAKVATYYNLSLSQNDKTFATSPTVNGVLDMFNWSTVTITSGESVNYGSTATLKYDIQSNRDVTPVEWPTPFTATGGVIINSGFTFYVKADKVFSTSAPLTINAGATLDTNYNSKLTFGGNFTNNGTFTAGASAIEITGTASQSISGFSTTGNVLVTKTSGKATLTGKMSAGALSISGGGLLNLGTLTTHTATTITLGGVGESKGTWGGNTSTATFKSSSYFDAATGYVTVSTASCTSGAWTGFTSTDWNTPSNWCDGTVPTSSTNVIINSGGNQPVIGAAAVCNSMTINSGAILTVSGTNTLTIGSGNWTNNGGTFNPGTGTVIFNAGNNYAINGTVTSETFNNITVNNTTSWATLSVGGSITTLNVLGNYTQTAGTFAAPATMIVGGNWVNTGGTFTPGTGTVTMTGTGKTIGGTASTTFNNLNLSGTASVTTAIATNIGGTLNIGDGTTFTAPAFSLTVTGPTTVGSGTSGTLAITSATGTKTFNGAVTINYGGTLTESAAAPLTFGSDVTILGTLTENGAATVGFAGSLTNYGTYTASTGTHTFTGAAKTIGGTNPISIPTASVTGTYTNSGILTNATSLSVTSPGVLTNNGTITATTALSGNGGLTQRTTGVLNIGGTSTITTLTAIATGNKVNYNGSAQTACIVTTYDNLTLSGSLAKTFATTPTVNNVLSMEGTASVMVTTGVVTYGPNATLQYNKPAAYTATLEEWVTPFTATGGIIIANTGAITMNNVANVLNANIPLTINSGATLVTPNAYLLTLGGNFTNNGTFTGGSGGVTIAGTATTQSIDDFTTIGAVTMAKTGGTATLTGNVNGAGLTINGAGGTLNLGVGLTHTFTGVVTLTAGTLNGGSSMLNENATSAAAWNGNGSLFTAGTGTVTFGGGAQTLSASTTIFNNIVLGGSGTKTFTTVTTTTGDFSFVGTAVAYLGALTHSAKTLTFLGSEQTSGSWGGSAATTATNKSSTYFGTTATGILNVSSCDGLWVGGTAGALTDWNTKGNWCSNTVPTALTNVTIPNVTNKPVIGTTGGSCNNLTINAGASLTISTSSTLTINGNFTNAGTFAPSTNPTSTVNYAGTNQTVLDVSYGNLTLSGSGTKTYTVTAARTANALTVASGVNFLLNGANTFTPVNAVINGSVTATNGKASPDPANGDGLISLAQGSGTISFTAGSFFYDAIDGGVIPNANWDVNSTCDITGFVKNPNGTPNNTFQTSLNQVFGNFTWDSKNQQALTGQEPYTSLTGRLSHVKGNLTINSTGTGQVALGINGTGDFLVDGNFVQTGGSLILSAVTARKIYVAGNFSVSGTNTIFDLSSSTTIANYSTVNIGGNFNFTSGTITESGSTTASVINFNGTSGTQIFTSGGIFSQAVNFAINSGAVVDFGTSILGSGSTGSFTLNAGGTLITANTAGITTAGATGSIQLSGVRTYNAGANYIYNGTIPQVTGNGLAQNTPANVTISNNTGVTFSAATTMTNLFLTTGAKANLGNYVVPGHIASALYLNGEGNYTGTWGGTTSTATNINATYFASNSGILTLTSATSLGISSSTTFTPPCEVTSVTVEAWGGGGAGSTLTSGTLGAGGGGGAYTKNTLTVIPGTKYTVTIGQGGTSGINGGDTWFGSTTTLLLAKGGGSATVNSNIAGAGGLASACTPTTGAFSGGNGAVGSTTYGGGGGSSAGSTAAGTNGVTANNTGGTAPSGGGSGGNGGTAGYPSGVAGSTPGGGGGGAYGISAGGNGSNGKIIITYVNIVPTITFVNNLTTCYGSAANLEYSSTTGCPDTYSINFDATAQAAGFVNVSAATLPATPITLTVPATAPAATYNGTLIVKNSSTNVTSNSYPFTLTVNPTPAIANMTVTAYSGETFTLTPVDGTNGVVPSGTTYSWSAPSGTGFTGGTANSDSQTSISGTLVLTATSATAIYTVTPTSGSCSGNPFTVTVTITPNFWVGTAASTDWSLGTNWMAGTPPADGDDVVFANTPNNDLVLDGDRRIGNLTNTSTKRLFIPAGKSLTINGAINTNNDSTKIYIQSSSAGPNGTLIFKTTSAVYGTVEMYSQAFCVDQTNKKGFKWQYFGIPVENIKASPTFDGSYVRSWDERQDSLHHWVRLTNDSIVKPFYGYEITQLDARTIVFQGKLINRDFSSGVLAVSPAPASFPGQHIFANPYTAAINIKYLTFGADADSTVYMYNTGSLAEWTTSHGSATNFGGTPGQYTSIPQKTAGNLMQLAVPSMQAMLIRPNPKSSTFNNFTFGISYNSVIMKNVDQQKVAGNKIQQTTDSITGSFIELKGTNFSDRMWLFSQKGCTRTFDNGWDGVKMPGTALAPQIYAMEPDGNYQVDAVEDVNNTLLGFQAGVDPEYTLTFTHQNLASKYAGMFLVDMVENKTIDITESGSTYSFSAASTPIPVKRFMIVTRSNDHGTPDGNTRLKVFSSGNTVFVQNLSNLNGEMIVYDMIGHTLKRAIFEPYGVTAVQVCAVTGAYIVKASTSSEKVSEKIIIEQ